MAESATLLDKLPLPPMLVRARARKALKRRLEALAPSPDQDPRHRRQARIAEIERERSEPDALPRLCWGDLPLEFWRLVLGSRLHAGAALWPRWAKDHDQAETEWCRQAAKRLGLEPGQRLLEIGACPGTLARWAEVEMPGLEATLLPSSPESRRLLDEAVAALGPAGASLPSATLDSYDPSQPFDRILVVEGFTRSANPGPLLDRALSWLAPDGCLLLQVACHWRSSYDFAPGDEHRWMLPEVPDGALHPGQQYLDDLARPLRLLSQWELSGEHYERTASAWLQRLEKNSDQLLAVLRAHGVSRPKRTLRAWRDALLALEATYGFRKGQEWCVTQMLLANETNGRRATRAADRI